MKQPPAGTQHIVACTNPAQQQLTKSTCLSFKGGREPATWTGLSACDAASLATAPAACMHRYVYSELAFDSVHRCS